jgi:hypothetical protein
MRRLFFWGMEGLDLPFGTLMAGHSARSWRAGRPEAAQREAIPGSCETVDYLCTCSPPTLEGRPPGRPDAAHREPI